MVNVSQKVLINATIFDLNPPSQGNVKAFINATTPFALNLINVKDDYWTVLWNNASLYPNGWYNISFSAIDSSSSQNQNAQTYTLVYLRNPDDFTAPSINIITPLNQTAYIYEVPIELLISDINPPFAGEGRNKMIFFSLEF